jgi:long-chain-alcohol oxidase
LHSLPSRRDETIRAGLDKLGWQWEVMERNVRGCSEEVCRLCHYGCQLGAKQSTLKTWVQDAHDAGARVLVETRAERVTIEGGEARGVEARTAAGHRVTVRARAVVSACGALQTPVLLGRSGIPSKALGKHLRLHPVLVVWGQFDEEVRPWEGMLSSTFSDQDADMDGRGYGVKYEHVATPPSILLSFSPWRGGRRHAELMQAMPYTGGVGVLLRDRGVGEVRTARDGQPVVRYRLSPEDVDHMRRGVRGAARVVEAMGARRIYSSHSNWVPTSRACAATWTALCATPTPAAGARARRSSCPSTSWAARGWVAPPTTRSATPRARSGTSPAYTSVTAPPSPRPRA